MQNPHRRAETYFLYIISFQSFGGIISQPVPSGLQRTEGFSSCNNILNWHRTRCDPEAVNVHPDHQQDRGRLVDTDTWVKFLGWAKAMEWIAEGGWDTEEERRDEAERGRHWGCTCLEKRCFRGIADIVYCSSKSICSLLERTTNPAEIQ